MTQRVHRPRDDRYQWSEPGQPVRSASAAAPIPATGPKAAGSDGRGAIFLGLVLVLVGGYFLAQAYLPDVDLDRAWPRVVIVLGVALLLAAIRRSPGTSA